MYLKAYLRTLDEKALKDYYTEMILGHIRFSEPKKLIKPQPKDLTGLGFKTSLERNVTV